MQAVQVLPSEGDAAQHASINIDIDHVTACVRHLHRRRSLILAPAGPGQRACSGAEASSDHKDGLPKHPFKASSDAAVTSASSSAPNSERSASDTPECEGGAPLAIPGALLQLTSTWGEVQHPGFKSPNVGHGVCASCVHCDHKHVGRCRRRGSGARPCHPGAPADGRL
jgi:hypothetical protein